MQFEIIFRIRKYIYNNLQMIIQSSLQNIANILNINSMILIPFFL